MSYPIDQRAIGISALLLALSPPTFVHAAQPETSLNPLVITADRPYGSTLLANDLHLFQADSLADLSGLTPGFAVVTSDTRGYGDIMSMRGSSNTLFFSPPAVGMVVDDVAQGDTCSYPSGLLAMDQIKVLRGPQGTLYGRNGPAGMLEMTTPQPGTTNVYHLTTDFGSYDSWGARLTTAGPLAAGFSQSVQLYHQQRDGFITNPTLGHTVDDRSITGGLANLFWKPAPDTEWRLRIGAERSQDGGPRLSLLESRNPFRVTSDIPGETQMERTQISLHYTQEGPWGRIKSITAWQDWQLDPSITDLDLIDSHGYGMSSTIVQDQQLWTQEFRWESPQEATPWSWRTGVFFMNQASSGDATRVLGGPYSETTLYDLTQWNAAAYGRLSYAINPNLNVLVGTRVEYVTSEIDRVKTSTFAPQDAPVRGESGAWQCSPELGASYTINDTTRVFARTAIGVKPAGFSAFAKEESSAHYHDEVAWTNELGTEVSMPDAHLTGSLTGFWNRIHDYQLNRSATDYTTDFYTVNAGPVTTLGMEAEVRWQPVDSLTVQGCAGVTHAQFESAATDGNPVPFVPAYTGSLGARYDFPHGYYIQSSGRLTGATTFDESRDSHSRQGAYFCWDAEIGYATKHFSVALFGRNLLDREYYSFINRQIEAGVPGDPQIFGIRTTMEF